MTAANWFEALGKEPNPAGKAAAIAMLAAETDLEDPAGLIERLSKEIRWDNPLQATTLLRKALPAFGSETLLYMVLAVLCATPEPIHSTSASWDKDTGILVYRVNGEETDREAFMAAEATLQQEVATKIEAQIHAQTTRG